MENENSRLNQLKSLLADSENDSFLIFAIAKEYENIGNYPAALENYEKIVKINPDYVGVYFHFARLLIETSDDRKAMEIFEQGMRIAEKLKDSHALSELKSAKINYELGF